MLTPDYATILVDQLLLLDNKRTKAVLWNELTRRRKEIDLLCSSDMTEEKHNFVKMEEHLIDSFKAYNTLQDAKIKLLERAVFDMVRRQNEIRVTYSDLKWQSSVIGRLRELKNSIK